MARPSIQRVNLASIAERLGVSISTVSRALRGQNGIHPETEARIVGLAQEMGYALRVERRDPTRVAPEALRHVLVLSQCSSPHIDQRFMAGMSGAAVAANVAILSHLVSADRCTSVLDPRQAPASMRAGMVKGVIFLHRWPVEVVEKVASETPAVSIVHDYPGTESDLIGVDDRRGVAELVAHLLATGRRRIGFFGLCPEVSWSSARFAAYVESLTRADLAYEPRNVVRVRAEDALSPDEFGSSSWAAAVRERMRAGVDAWICPSAMTGRTLCRFLLKSGLHLPDDVALASYHGASVRSGEDLPIITTTDVVDEELGAAAVRRLLHRMDNPGESRRAILVPARLKVGETTPRMVRPAGVAA